MSGHLLESAALPAFAVMLLGARHLALSGRTHWAQVLGVATSAAVMITAASMFAPAGPATAIVPLLGLLPAVALARWAPGPVPSLLVALLTFVGGGAMLDGQIRCQDCLLIAYAAWFTVLGAVGAVVLVELLPPPAMTLSLSIGSWTLGTAYLMGAPAPPQWQSVALVAGWVSGLLLCAAALLHFAAQPSLPWALGLVVTTVLLTLDVVPMLTAVMLLADLLVLRVMYRRHLGHMDLP